MKGDDLRAQFGVNQWLRQKKVVTSLDLAKRDDILPGLRQAHWDLVVVDEAHRMSAPNESHKSQRYKLGELLRDSSDHILLLTATPHKGDPQNFSLFLQLLDRDAYADVRSIREAMDAGRAPFYLRRTKEAMVYFPQRDGNGAWAARPIFTKRIPRTVDFRIDGAEFELYRQVTRFVKRQSARAAAAGDDRRARAVGFLMALYQRRLTSSARAIRCSLANRADRLERGLAQAEDLARTAPPDLPSMDELDEMEERDRERLERLLEAVSLAGSAETVRQEIAELRALAGQALEVERAGAEAKLAKLEELLRGQGFFDRPDQRLVLFSEFKDTLDYLVEKLAAWGFAVATIHGGMKPGSREEPGTRLHAEQRFREGAAQVLAATEAAGEGINLQVCNILFNYDIPWNPNRLEERMGRIHRYGQEKDCLIFNFVATNTKEGQVLERLLDKLQEIRDALDDDAVFNVVGEVLPAARIERVLRDYYAGRLGDEDLEDRLLRDVDETRFRNICRNALEGLASKKLNLEIAGRAPRPRPGAPRRAGDDRPASCATPPRWHRCSSTSWAGCPTRSSPDARRRPSRRYEREPDWKLPELAARYPRCSTDRDTARKHTLEWVTPGHPLFEAVRRHAHEQAREPLARGATYHSLAHEAPTRIDFYRARVVDGLGGVVHERVFAAEMAGDGAPRRCEPGVLGDLTPAPAPAPAPDALPAIARRPEPLAWLQEHVLAPFLDETRGERLAETGRVADHVELSLTELLQRADDEIGRVTATVERGAQGAEGRLALAEARHGELLARRERRREELQQQRALSLQGVERITSVLVLPHPDRTAAEVRRHQPDPATEATAMRVVIDHEQSHGRHVEDVSAKNLGYDVTSLDTTSGDLRLIEVKGLAAPTGTILLTPNEHRVAEDRRDCYWLYVVTNCAATPVLREPIADPARFPWHEVTKVQHYYLSVDAMTRPMTVRENTPPFATRD